MKRTVLSILLLSLLIGCIRETKIEKRSIVNFGRDWQFKKATDPHAGSGTWTDVTVPHIPKIEPLVITDQWQGMSWYQKTFNIPEDVGRKVFIYFEGVMHETDVFVNGKLAVHHVGGYLPFTVDATPYIKFGEENRVKVKTSNWDNPEIPPGKPIENLDFNYYGGIYRNVYLIITDPIYISDPVNANKSSGGGVLVHFNEVDQNMATGFIKVHVKNECPEGKAIYFEAILKDADAKAIRFKSEPVIVQTGSNFDLIKNFTIERPKLWSPQYPNLYDIEIRLFASNKLVDNLTLQTGIRSLELSEGGFSINGEKQYIRGTNRHQEYPYIGYALSDEAQWRDAVKIKNAGFDLVRLSHYPQAEAFLNACDELGLMVMNCIPGWQYFGDSVFQENALKDCRDMIRRDRNHPSVVFWELSLNESQMTDEFIQHTTQILKEELPFEGVYSAGWTDHPAYDLFIPARQHGQPPDYWNFYKDGKRPVFIAEYGDWEYYAQNAGFNQTDFADLKEDERTSRQLREAGEQRLLQQALNFQEAANSNRKGSGTIGDANWLMFDYNRGYSPDLETSGISDIFRIPKFSYYFYQSQRSPDKLADERLESGPMVKIASYWNKESPLEIKVYSNCGEVALYLNNTLVSRQKPTIDQYSTHLSHPPFIFDLEKFTPGHLEAVGFIDGQVRTRDIVTTPGKATAIRLAVDLSSIPINTEYPDVLFVYASVVDENGTVVPDASHQISFTVDGGAELIGENPAPAKAGITAILLRTDGLQGPVKIMARSEGLDGGEVVIGVE